MIPPPNLRGEPLLDSDYAALEARWISREQADAAFLRRVDTFEGAQLIGQAGKEGHEWKAGPDYSGIVIPYLWPGDPSVRCYRLRRDNPDIEQGLDGKIKLKKKYMGEAGRGNSLYFPPSLEPRFLGDTGMPVIVVEGEFKTLALWRLAWYGLGDSAEAPAFIPIGLQGVNSWRGSLGRVDQEGPWQGHDIKGPISDLARLVWLGRKVIILYDANVESNEQVGWARQGLTQALAPVGAEVYWFRWPADIPETMNGVDDFLAARGADETIRILAKARKVTRKRKGGPTTVAEAVEGEDGWRKKLICGDNGVKPLLANAITFLTHTPDLATMVAFDEFAVRTVALAGTPWNPSSHEWSEIDDIRLAEWLQRHGCQVGKNVTHEAVDAVARDRSFHPMREYLSKLEWDNTPRLDAWLCTYIGVKDSKYSRAVGSRWLISAVARVYEPGCQVDHCLILQGPQGQRKSTALRVLAGEWFTDQVGDLSNKDSQQQLQGVSIVEFSELEQLLGLRAETAIVKAFITRRVDRFRPPYGTRVESFPRQCVFAGTVNLGEYFRDDTGARRFWPVLCGVIDTSALERDRDQIWAEARVRYEAREPWYLDTPELIELAAVEQDTRYEADPWDSMVWDFVEGARAAHTQSGHPPEAFYITNSEVLTKALKKPEAAWQEQDKRRIGRIMRRHGVVALQETVYGLDGEIEREPNGRAKRRRVYRWPSP